MVKFLFLPSSTTSLLQPMDQGVISKFKLYLKHRVRCCAFTYLVDLESSQIWWIWKANIETFRSRDDVAAFVTLGRRLDDQGL
jgi:hypothetical protein